MRKYIDIVNICVEYILHIYVRGVVNMGGGQNLERPISRSFEISNIKIT